MTSYEFSSTTFLAATQLGTLAWIATNQTPEYLKYPLFRDRSFIPELVLQGTSADSVCSHVARHPVDVLVYDGVRPPNMTHPLWRGLTIPKVILLFGSRPRSGSGSNQVGWHARSFGLEHHGLGGVTHWHGDLMVALKEHPVSKASGAFPNFDPIGVSAVFGHIVNRTAKGGVPAKAPASSGSLDPHSSRLLINVLQDSHHYWSYHRSSLQLGTYGGD